MRRLKKTHTRMVQQVPILAAPFLLSHMKQSAEAYTLGQYERAYVELVDHVGFTGGKRSHKSCERLCRAHVPLSEPSPFPPKWQMLR